jgi:hypothetical protein
VLGFVARRTQLTYPFVAASRLGIDVLSGPVGTKSSVESFTGDQMAVCGNGIDTPCTFRVAFHEAFMRIDQHPKSERRYFVYDATTREFINILARIK